MAEQTDPTTRMYEIRLITSDGQSRLFAKAAPTDEAAADYGKGLLLRHLDCESGEVWYGMKLIRQL